MRLMIPYSSSPSFLFSYKGTPPPPATQATPPAPSTPPVPTATNSPGNNIQCMLSGFPTSLICGELRLKKLWSFAHIVRRDQINSAQNTDQATRTCERFVCSTVKRTLFWLSNDFFTTCERACGLSFLVCALVVLANSHGYQVYIKFH